MSLVSVIIPTYNRAHVLPEAITSVLEQTFTDFELIVVDDGSTDNTKEILAPFSDKIRYFYQENKGPASARNLGIQKAQGRYICFLDSDDLWLKDKLQTQIDLVKKDPSIKICYTDEIWIRKGVRVNPKKKHQKYSGWIFEKSVALCIISPSSVLMDREIFDEVGLFDERLPVAEDYDMWLRVSSRYPITFIDKPLIIKRGGHEDQQSRKYWGVDRFRVKALEKILAESHLQPQWREAAVRHLQQKCQIIANGCFRRGKIEEGKYYLSIAEKYR